MGKRELLLVIAFVVVGVVVYQATAPPSKPGENSVSFSGLLEQVRRHVRGNQASAEITKTATTDVSDGTTELRWSIISGNGGAESLTIIGEDRDDIASEMRVWSNGYDEAEAARWAQATKLETNVGGGRISMGVNLPREARQRATVVLRIPEGFRVNVSRQSGKISISNVESVDLVETRGEVTIEKVKERAIVSHRGGEVNVSDAGGLKINIRGSDARFARIHGDLTITAQAGEVTASEIGGAIDIDSSSTDVLLEKLDAEHGPVRINAVSGTVKMTGVRNDARIDARNTDVTVVVDKAAALAIYNEGGSETELTPPSSGCMLDALATSGGKIRVSNDALQVKTTESEDRLMATLGGGGPTITLRSNRGDIVIRKNDGSDGNDAERPKRREGRKPK
jgi:putative adhesin